MRRSGKVAHPTSRPAVIPFIFVFVLQIFNGTNNLFIDVTLTPFNGRDSSNGQMRQRCLVMQMIWIDLVQNVMKNI